MMIGNGRDRGAQTFFDPFGPNIAPTGQPGWELTGSKTLRWGINKIHRIPSYTILDTRVFLTRFDADSEFLSECQATTGDSGGGVFTLDPSTGPRLAGIMLSRTLEFGQSASSSIFTNETIIASLDGYADEIDAHIAVPEPRGAFGAGLLLLAAFYRTRNRDSGRFALSPNAANS